MYPERAAFLKDNMEQNESIADANSNTDVDSKDSPFYADAARYWSSVPPTGKFRLLCIPSKAQDDN